MRRPRCIAFTAGWLAEFALDLGWLLPAGLAECGWGLFGGGIGDEETDVEAVCRRERPDVVFVDMPLVWDPEGPWRAPKRYRLHRLDWLLRGRDVYRVSRYCDPCTLQAEHRRWYERFRPDAYVVRYRAGDVLCHDPWIAPGSVLRVMHSVVREQCRPVRPRTGRAVLCGARTPQTIYPLRARLGRAARRRPLSRWLDVLDHPGYRRGGGSTVPGFLRILERYRVAVFDAPYGWAVKKHWESTAAGCRVVTTLPTEDELPGIDGNLIRVGIDVGEAELAEILREAIETWDLERQRHYAELCVDLYDYRHEASLLDAEIRRRWRASRTVNRGHRTAGEEACA